MERLDPALRTDTDDGDTVETDVVRVDRSTLRRARTLDDGSVVYEAVLARADVPMRYAHGEEVATVEALSDPEYLEALRGLSVTVLHPPRDRVDVDIDHPDAIRRVGTVVGSRYDTAERAAIVEFVLFDPAAIERVKRENGVSEGYRADVVRTPGKPGRQIRRRPNHVALAFGKPPRMPGAGARVDTTSEGKTMDPTALLVLLSAFALRTDTAENLREDLDALKAARDAAEAEKLRADTAEAEVALLRPVLEALGGDTRTDTSGPIDVDALLASRVGEVVRLRERGTALGIKVPDALTGAGDIRRHLAKALGGDETRCDSADYCDGVIDRAPIPDSVDAFKRSATPRNDALPAV